MGGQSLSHWTTREISAIEGFLGTCLLFFQFLILGFPGGSDGKESACNAGDLGQSLGREDPLEEEMVTHSSILAMEVPWTEEPGELLSMGSQKSRAQLTDKTTTEKKKKKREKKE